MILKEERSLVVEYGRKLLETGLTTGTGGNLSIYNEEEGFMAISPSGIDYFKIEPEDVVVMDLEGRIIESDKKPSSEYQMHKILYQKRDDVKAVVHTHSIYATVVASLKRELPAVHYLIAFGGNKVPCAEYATFGTEELAQNAFEAVGYKYKATLLANHGLLTVGNNIATAFAAAEGIEFTAKIYCLGKSIGETEILPDKELEVVGKMFETYGQK